MDSTDDKEEYNIRLKSGINIEELTSGDGTTFEVDLEDLEKSAKENESSAADAEVLKYANLDCLGIEDEDTYNEEPFGQLAAKMEDLLPDGKVKKRILREGVGEIVPENGFITCDYNAYFEYNPEPFDSTYAFRRSFRFQLGSGNILLGMDIAIRSMKIGEKSQFLVHPDYAYGALGCLDRIPENSTILFEIELKNCVNSGQAENFEEKEEQTFEAIYEYAEALRQKGNDLYKRNLTKQAIREYNIAISKLQKVEMKDYADQEKQQDLLLKLYTNLVVVYTKQQSPKQACKSANEIYYLVKGTSLKVPAKVFFNHARALMMLGELAEAEVKLKCAHRLEPNSPDIAGEFIKLNKLKKEALERDKHIAKGLTRNYTDKQVLSDDFKMGIDRMLTDLVNDPDWLQNKLDNNLTEDEITYVKTAAAEKNLLFRQEGKQYYVYKGESKE